jgi:hypothetical protein
MAFPILITVLDLKEPAVPWHRAGSKVAQARSITCPELEVLRSADLSHRAFARLEGVNVSVGQADVSAARPTGASLWGFRQPPELQVVQSNRKRGRVWIGTAGALGPEYAVHSS